MSAQEAALRVEAFLDQFQRDNGFRGEYLLTLVNNRYSLRVSDLRALVAAVPSGEPAPFMWFVRGGRMWHAGCGKEISAVHPGRLLCECGRGTA